jgi:hypothetical protein
MDEPFLSAFVLSLIAAFALKRTFPGETAPAVINYLAWIFLAILAIETFSKNVPNLRYLGFGALFLVVVSSIAFMLRGFKKTESSDYLAIASGTFGGGNRGFALISVICALPIFSTQQRGDIVTAYLQVDVTVLAWLMFVVPFLFWLRKITGTLSYIDSAKSVATDVGAPPLIVMAIVLTSGLFSEQTKAFINAALEPTHTARSMLLLFLSLTYVFMKTSLGKRTIGSVAKTASLFYLPRVVTGVATLLGAMTIFDKSALGVILEYPLVLPVLVFAFCPPSNGMHNFMERFHAPKKRVSEIADLNIVTTIVFLLILLAVTILRPLI